MKIDKELLLKHKFWVMLLLTVPLSLFSIFVLMSSVSAEITKKKKEITDAIKRIQSVKDIVNQGMIDEKKKEADKLKDAEREAHGKAYEPQKGIALWPKDIEDRFDFAGGYFAYHVKIQAKDKGEDKSDDKGPGPPKEDRVVHGKITKAFIGDFFEVTANDKKVYRFFKTPQWKISAAEEATGTDDVGRLKDGELVTVAYNRGKYFMSDSLTGGEQTAYVKVGVYHAQLLPILKQIQPMDERGNGIVQLKGWWFDENRLPPTNNKFLSYVAAWKHLQADISEEAWLAQEDIWVQTELYRLIAQANEYVSEFKLQGKAEKGKPQTFKNPYWELVLNYPGGNKLQIQLKNLQDRRQKLDVRFRFRFDETFEPETYLIGGEPLAPRGDKESVRKIDLDLKDGPRRTGIYGVEQVLTWETAAVKRIDQISIGSMAANEISHGHRTFAEGLTTYAEKGKKEEGAPPEKGAPDGKLNVGGGPKDDKAEKKAGDLTVHGLNRRRYLEVTPQARRIPVALSLIVDQDHVDRVQMAFANSRLRFLMTQVVLNRYPSSVRPQISGGEDKGGKGNFKGALNPGAGGAKNAGGGGEDLEANVELVLYGIVTLYERFPPAKRLQAEAKQ